MSPARFAVRRPVLTAMLTLVVALLGVVSLDRLRIDLLPDVERPTVSVSTDYPGAAPEVVERRVTELLEQIVSTVPGVVELGSTSSQGESRLTVRFAWGSDLQVAVQDLRAYVEDELNELPEEVERPQLRTFDINSFPVVVLGISSPLDPLDLNDLIEDELADRFARVPGVAQVDPWGGFPRELRVELHPKRMRAMGVTGDEVIAALADNNLDLPAGRVRRGTYDVALRAPADLADPETVAATVVALRAGVPVRLDQVATLTDTYQERTRLVRVGDDVGVRLAIRRSADANTVEVAAGVLAEAERINRAFPQVTVVPVINQGSFIEQSIDNVLWSVVYGGVVAVVVLLGFLRDLRATLVVATSIPVAILATFVLLLQGGFTLNLMTLGGLALGVGMMVDSAIVVLENIFHRREQGDEPWVAAHVGADEVAPAITASTITTLVIFLPVLFVGGVAGLLFSELGYVIALSLCASLAVSLTLVPMLAARLPAARPPHEAPRWAQRAAAGLDRVELAYASLLQLTLRRRRAALVAAGALLALTVIAGPRLGTELLPPSDEGEVRVTGEMELGTAIDVVDRQTRYLEAAVRQLVPDAVARVTSVRGGITDDAIGEIRVALGPTSERARSNTAIAAALREHLDGHVPGMVVRTRAPQGSFALNRVLGSNDEGIVVEIRGDDLATLTRLAEQVRDLMLAVDGVTDVDDSRPEGLREERLQIDRRRAAELGLSVRDIAELLQTAMAGRQVGMYRADGDAYRIFVQVARAADRTLDEVLDLPLRSPAGDTIPLRQLVDVTAGRGPVTIERREQRRIVKVTANVAGRPAGTVAAEIAAQLDELPRPPGYQFALRGAFEAQQDAFGELTQSLVLALLLVYMVLAAQYESLKDPVVVMASVPFAGVGVVAALWVTGTTLNLQSGIGAILLGGIVVNNAILIVDLASTLRTQHGVDATQAAITAGRRRLRPILMTTATTLVGLLPLALGLGEGADAQAPLARAVIGGLATSTVASLLLLPLIYGWVHGERRQAPAPPRDASSEVQP